MSVALTSHWRAMGAIVRRDFAIFISYRGRLVEQVLASVGMILIFNFTAKLVNVPQFKTHGDYFAFVVVGIVSLQVLTSTLTTPPGAVRQELVAGTFERLVVSPFGPVLSTISMMVFPVLLTIVMSTFTILLAAIAFGMPITWPTAASRDPGRHPCVTCVHAVRHRDRGRDAGLQAGRQRDGLHHRRDRPDRRVLLPDHAAPGLGAVDLADPAVHARPST